MEFGFPESVKEWNEHEIKDLFAIELEKKPLKNSYDILANLKQVSKDIDELQLWLDCDREGESIAFDVMDFCQSHNKNIQVKRAHFSALTKEDISKALENLGQPNKNLSDAAKARSELDLRSGASFTRFQTLAFQNILGMR